MIDWISMIPSLLSLGIVCGFGCMVLERIDRINDPNYVPRRNRGLSKSAIRK